MYDIFIKVLYKYVFVSINEEQYHENLYQPSDIWLKYSESCYSTKGITFFVQWLTIKLRSISKIYSLRYLWNSKNGISYSEYDFWIIWLIQKSQMDLMVWYGNIELIWAIQNEQIPFYSMFPSDGTNIIITLLVFGQTNCRQCHTIWFWFWLWIYRAYDWICWNWNPHQSNGKRLFNGTVLYNRN